MLYNLFLNTIVFRLRQVILLSVAILSFPSVKCDASNMFTHIEIVRERVNDTEIFPFVYFVMTDMLTGEEKKVGSEVRYDGSIVVDFQTVRPLYDNLIYYGKRIPFYVEPGDSIRIRIGRSGEVNSYERIDGTPLECQRLLLHDVSRNNYYSSSLFREDTKIGNFKSFVGKLERRFSEAADTVMAVAEKYSFSEKERLLAVDNLRMQFALWLFEYAPKAMRDINAFAYKHAGGWQSLPGQDSEIKDLEDVSNYKFVKEFAAGDSLCIASRYFPLFVQSYQNSHYLTHDLYLYYDENQEGEAKTDSVLIAKDCALTGSESPSLFMDVIMARRHYADEPSITDDGSIKLEEVNVLGINNMYSRFNFSEPTNQEIRDKYWDPNNEKGGITSPISYFLNRRKVKGYNKAKEIIKNYEADDAEREAIMKAYRDMHPEYEE